MSKMDDIPPASDFKISKKDKDLCNDTFKSIATKLGDKNIKFPVSVELRENLYLGPFYGKDVIKCIIDGMKSKGYVCKFNRRYPEFKRQYIDDIPKDFHSIIDIELGYSIVEHFSRMFGK